MCKARDLRMMARTWSRYAPHSTMVRYACLASPRITNAWYMIHDTWCVEQAPPPLHVEWRPEKESKEANPLGLDDVRQAFAAFGGVRNVVMAKERSANGRRGARGAAPSCT